MKRLHSPGPWVYMPKDFLCDRILGSTGIVLVAQGIEVDDDRAVDEANMRLMAASPKMLEALDCALAHNQPYRSGPTVLPLPACCENMGGVITCRLGQMLTEAIAAAVEAP